MYFSTFLTSTWVSDLGFLCLYFFELCFNCGCGHEVIWLPIDEDSAWDFRFRLLFFFSPSSSLARTRVAVISLSVEGKADLATSGAFAVPSTVAVDSIAFTFLASSNF